jgi:hypothetical protein
LLWCKIGKDSDKVGRLVKSVGCPEDALDLGHNRLRLTDLKGVHPPQQLSCADEKRCNILLEPWAPAVRLDTIDNLLDCRSKVGLAGFHVVRVRSPGSEAGEDAMSAHVHYSIKDKVLRGNADCYLVCELEAGMRLDPLRRTIVDAGKRAEYAFETALDTREDVVARVGFLLIDSNKHTDPLPATELLNACGHDMGWVV